MKNKKLKLSKKDFTISSLPSTRGKQFFDIFKNEWRTLLLLGFIGLLFAIPYIVCVCLEMSLSDGTSYSMSQQGKTAAEISAQLNSIHRLFSAINIVSFGIFGVFIAGAIRVIRNLCLGEIVMFKHDFFKGINIYWKSFLLCFLINGLFIFIIDYISTTLTQVSSSALTQGVKGLTLGFYFVVIVPISLFNLTQFTFYSAPFTKRLKNSFKFAVVKFYLLIPFLLVLIGFYFITLIPNFLISILISILCILIIPVLFSLSFYLYSINLFDKYINKDHYPEIYRKGLSAKKE